MSNDGQTDGQAQLMSYVQELTQVLREVAAGGRGPTPDDEEVRLRRRVDFGYRALGTLMGRVTDLGRNFDVPTFTATWDTKHRVLGLGGLPREVTWIELRGDQGVEILPVIRDGSDTQGAAASGGKPPVPRVEPGSLTPDRPIESLLGLGGEQGPLLAFGPRVPAAPAPTAPR